MNRMHTVPARKVRPARRGALAAALLLSVLALAGPGWSAGSAPASDVKVNINTASVAELQALPGIGEARATQIVALRKERGAFRSVDELLEVRGIGPAMLERMRPQVSLSGKTQVGGPAPARKTRP